jgi:ferrous iron transport protein A
MIGRREEGRRRGWWRRWFGGNTCCGRGNACSHDYPFGEDVIKPLDSPEVCCRQRTLRDAGDGERVTIAGLRGDEGVCRRLREMGFCESATVEKIAESGALICRVCDARVVLSRTLAQNIIVGDTREEGVSMLLSRMSVGQKGVILGFTRETEDCERVEEMGVTPGEEVEVVRYAPMGDPIEIRIRGYALTLRMEEAELIQVEVLS